MTHMASAWVAHYGPFISAIILAAGLLRGQTDIDATVRFQMMEGFGTSVRVFDDPHVFENFNPETSRALTLLTTAQQDAVLERLYTDLRLTWVRPTTENGIEPVNDNNDPNRTDYSKFNFEWKRNDAHVEYVRRAIAKGAKNFFLSPIARESWMRVNTSNDVAEYAEWCMAILRRWRVLGLDLPYFSLANEPGNTPMFMTGSFMRDVIKRMGPMLREEGFPTKFVISDDLNPSSAYERCAVVLADNGARQYVAALATHLYGEPVTGMARMRQLAEQYRLPLWMTEFSRLEAGMSALEYAERIMHPLIADYNVSVHMYMWGFFGQWESPASHLLSLKHKGAVYTGYEMDKMYYVLGQFSRFVRPGAVRVKAESKDPRLKVTAYVDGGTLTVIAINNTDSRISEQISTKGLPAAAAFDAVRTSESEDGVNLPPAPASAQGFSVTLPPRSITTFVSRSAAASVVNAASLLPKPVAPGQIVTVFGSGLGPETPVEATLSSAGVLENTLGGTRLLFDDVPAPLLYVSSRQVNALVPYSVQGKSSARLQIAYAGPPSEVATVSVTPSSPGIFTATGTGTGQGAILNQDGSFNSAINPAPRGSIVSIFGTGEGQTNPAGQDGRRAAEPLPVPALPLSVSIGYERAEVLYAGAAPGFAGLVQLNARVPTAISPGPAVPITLTIGDAASQPDVTIAVH
jgi:uncharacterized protein (TIGR03437 family)